MEDIVGILKTGAKQAVKEVKKAGAVVAKKSGEIAEQTKLNFKVVSIEEKIEEVMMEIGKYIYDEHQSGVDFPEFVGEQCSRIDGLTEELNSVKKQLADIKKIKVCPKCSKSCDNDTKFCPECGNEF